MSTDQLPPPPPPDLIDTPRRRHGRITSEVMAGGSVVEKSDDELVGGLRGAVGVIGVVALIGLIGLFNVWWLVFVVGILIAVFLHELGHFVTARLTGMKATQFFIGFGPRLWSFRKGETEYGVRALPLGAFVRIIGMNNMDEVEPGDEDRTYRSKSYPRRLLVISAGSLMHMLIAIALLFGVYITQGEPNYDELYHIDSVLADSPAGRAGLQAGDELRSVDGRPLDENSTLNEIVQEHAAGDVIAVVAERDGVDQQFAIQLQENTDPGSPLFGKPYLGITRGTEYIEHSVGGAAVNAVTDLPGIMWQSVEGVVKALNPVNIVTHVAGTNDDLTTRPTTLVGVTGVSDNVGDQEGFVGILYLLALLNVFVGVFNMFPLLPLDGGHAAVATYERLRERRGRRYHADVAKLTPFAMAVMTVLLFLFVAGLYLDITQPLG